MAKPFKKTITRYHTPDGQRCGPDTPGAVKRVEEARKYYGLVPQPNGQRKPVALCPDMGRSKQLLNKLRADAAIRQHGMANPCAAHRKRPLADHLTDFRVALKARATARITSRWCWADCKRWPTVAAGGRSPTCPPRRLSSGSPS